MKQRGGCKTSPLKSDCPSGVGDTRVPLWRSYLQGTAMSLSSQQIQSHKSDQAEGDALGSRRKRTRREVAPPVQPPRPRTHTAAEPKQEQKPPRQCHEYEPGTRWVRRIGRRTFQARGYTFLGFINLGLFSGEEWQEDVVGERLAKHVAAEFHRRYLACGCPLAVFRAMQGAGKIPGRVLPPGAKKRPDGRYDARRWTPEGYVDTGLAFADPFDASLALLAKVRSHRTL